MLLSFIIGKTIKGPAKNEAFWLFLGSDYERDTGGCQSLNYESEVVCKCYSPLLMKTERQEEAHGGGNS